ncbi:MAG: hypothetical protein J6Z82_05895 [Schwartzia sp.]|nr:hypothetical protein [Schwartzia sp. (in: firmicutes)]
MNKIERVAKILELAEIPFSWLKYDDDGNGVSLILDDNSSTISFVPPDTLRIFVNSDVSFSTFEQSDLGDALRIIMDVRYMQRVDGVSEKSCSEEWIE